MTGTHLAHVRHTVLVVKRPCVPCRSPISKIDSWRENVRSELRKRTDFKS